LFCHHETVFFVTDNDGGLLICQTIQAFQRFRKTVEQRARFGRFLIDNAAGTVVIDRMDKLDAGAAFPGQQHGATQSAVRAF
jgi:hypothetical protein